MKECAHHNQQRGRGQEGLHWVCSDCGATITAKDWKDEQARRVAEHRGLEIHERGGTFPGVTPLAQINLTSVDQHGRPRFECQVGPMAPTKEVENMTLSDLYPIAILQDRYGGTYSGGEWIAVAESFDGGRGDGLDRLDLVRAGAFGSDREAADFWDKHESAPWVAVGPTPNCALAALLDKQRGVIP